MKAREGRVKVCEGVVHIDVSLRNVGCGDFKVHVYCSALERGKFRFIEKLGLVPSISIQPPNHQISELQLFLSPPHFLLLSDIFSKLSRS